MNWSRTSLEVRCCSSHQSAMSLAFHLIGLLFCWFSLRWLKNYGPDGSGNVRCGQPSVEGFKHARGCEWKQQSRAAGAASRAQKIPLAQEDERRPVMRMAEPKPLRSGFVFVVHGKL